MHGESSYLSKNSRLRRHNGEGAQQRAPNSITAKSASEMKMF